MKVPVATPPPGVLVPLFLAVASGACRSEPESSALARTTVDARDSGAALAADSANLRRLWSAPGAFHGSSPSPDGRWFTETDWSTGDLAVRDLATGELHRLTSKGTWEDSRELTETAIFSPDGDRIAYTWYNTSFGDYELRVLDFRVGEDGVPVESTPRVIFSNAELTPYWLFGWSENGQILATIYRRDRTNALGLISVEDGTLEIVESFDWREPRAVLSPDGSYVAYDFPKAEKVPERDIHLISIRDGREVTLVDGPGSDRVLAWLPDARGLLFRSERSGTPAVWRLPMDGYRPSGPAVLVRETIPLADPMGLGGDGLFLRLYPHLSRFYTVALDVDAARMAGAPEAFDDPHDGVISTWDWSPDGVYIAHNAVRSRRSDPWVVLRSSAGEYVRDFQLDLQTFGRLRWAPDQESLFLSGYDDQGRPGLRRLHLASGELETVRYLKRAREGGRGDRFALSPDGGEVFFRVGASDATTSPPGTTRGWMLARNLSTGEERRVGRVNSVGHQSVSPDGRWIAYSDLNTEETFNRLLVTPVEGGEPRELFRVEFDFPQGGTIREPVWTEDSRTLLFLSTSLEGKASLWKVPAHGGEPMRFSDFDDLQPSKIRLHPDGRHLAFRSGGGPAEIWILEGILPRDVSGASGGGGRLP